MKLHDVISPREASWRSAEPLRVVGSLGHEITGLTVDYRQVEPGLLFAATCGERASGIEFVPAALRAGAEVLLLPEGSEVSVSPEVTVLTAARPRRALALMAARLAGAQPKTVVAVTGTCGKTSTTIFARQLWTLLGHRAGSLGTVGLIAPGWERETTMTTPHQVALHPALAVLAEENIHHLALEASSQGLDQYRLDGVDLAAAAFTNLSHDHLDYHDTMAAYLRAKLRLFSELLPPGAHAVVNADSDVADSVIAIALRRDHRLIRFGRKGDEIRLLRQIHGSVGQLLELEVFGRRHEVTFPVVGEFQAQNLLAAIGLLVGTGADPEMVIACVSRVAAVPGRAELVAMTPSGGAVYVDYAHTPAALEAVLKTLRGCTGGRLVVLFGCGGERDVAKRRAMGAVAALLVDRVIVTDDNPRTEEPSRIREDILRGAPDALEIGDRASAIRTAMQGLRTGDVLVIAGKGHETHQIVGLTKLPFDDRLLAQRIAEELRALA